MARVRSWSAACPAFLLIAASPGVAALEIEPAIELAEAYSNNIDLAPSGAERYDWGTRVAPGVRISHEGAGLQFVADYTMEAWFFSRDSDSNEVYNTLASTAILDLIGRDLQLRADGSIEQVNVDPEKPITSDTFNTTGNLSEALTWEVGPQWRRQIWQSSEVDGFATAGRIDFDDDTVQDVDLLSGHFSLHTDAKADAVTSYQLAYDYEKLEYDLSGDVVTQGTFLELGYKTTDYVRLIGVVGLDNDIADPGDTSMSESRWEAGFAAEFGNSRMRVTGGHRYFGSTLNLSWETKVGESVYNASFTETPSNSDLTTVRELSTTDPFPDEPAQTPPDSTLERPGTPTRQIVKRADAGASWAMYRSQIDLALYWEELDDQVLVSENTTEALLDDEESYGVVLTWRWTLGPRSVVSVSADWRDRTYNNLGSAGCDIAGGEICEVVSVDDTLTRLRFGVDYMLGERTTLGFATGVQRRDGGTSEGDYDEFSAIVSLARKIL